MDLAFLHRAEHMLARPAATPAIDYGVLVATLAAHQAASATARAAAAHAGAGRWEAPREALVELLAAGPAWRDAARALGGSFRRTPFGKEP
jgi:hypothetical protein